MKPEYYNMQGWPPGEAEQYTPILLDCFDRGGWFCGVFDESKLIGVAILDSNFIGKGHDQLQLKFLHVSRDHRKQGLGKKLFQMAAEKARAWGAKQMYISATPSENTVNFYMSLGAVVTEEPDPELFALEPEDIHFECDIWKGYSMTIQFRNYNGQEDYARISAFLIAHHRPNNADGNWIEPMWEYMHFHSSLDSTSLGKIGIWEAAGEIVAVAHYESRLGEAFFQFHPAHRHLRQEMLDHAESNLAGISSKDGRRFLYAYVNDNAPEFQALVHARGYTRDPEGDRPVARFDIPDPFPPITLPEGFRLTSLAEECDWAKVHQVLWRGFDNGDDVPMNEEEFESRRMMFETPKARRDLKIAVAAPNGDFASFCGMFYEPTNQIAYVEPVATDPRYRRLGLGKAAVLEGIRRCGALGATSAYVGNDLPIYQSAGFKKVYNTECWLKYFE